MMLLKPAYTLYMFLFILLYSCSEPKKEQKNIIPQNTDTNKTVVKNTIQPATDTLRSGSVKMYNFPKPSIQGDFNGDGATERLQSCLFSKRDGRIMTEYPAECEWGCITDYDPILYLKSDNPDIPKLYPGELTPQLYGVAIMSNIGDVNRDGRDEVGIIIHYASMGGLNTCYIYEFCNNMWNKLFSFGISEPSLIKGEQYCPNPTDISDHIFKKNNEYYYSVFVGDRNIINKLHPLPGCGIKTIDNREGLTKKDFTGTWEIGDKGYYISIDVKKDTVIYFDCSDGKLFPSVNYEWVGDTLVVYEDNRLGDIHRYGLYLNSKTTMNCNEDGCIHRRSYKPKKESECGFFD